MDESTEQQRRGFSLLAKWSIGIGIAFAAYAIVWWTTVAAVSAMNNP